MARVTYPKEARERAVLLFRDHSAGEVAAILHAEGHSRDITAALVRKWASRAGVQSERAEIVAPMLEAAAVSVEHRRAVLAETMLAIAEQAAAKELELIDSADLRSVVGARTRAIHDLQLLTGAATSRTEQAAPEKAHGLVDELAARKARNAA
jgi:hypothetical protein